MSRFDPIGSAILNFYPLPNYTDPSLSKPLQLQLPLHLQRQAGRGGRIWDAWTPTHPDAVPFTTA